MSRETERLRKLESTVTQVELMQKGLVRDANWRQHLYHKLLVFVVEYVLFLFIFIAISAENAFLLAVFAPLLHVLYRLLDKWLRERFSR